MLMPSIFGENLFNDDWMDFSFPDVDKVLYGKHAKNVMKTDVKETDNSYEVDIDLPGFKKDEIEAKLENGYLTISAAKGLDKEEKDEKDGKYIRKERYSGAMSRSFYVGDELKQPSPCVRSRNWSPRFSPVVWRLPTSSLPWEPGGVSVKY